MSKTIRKLVLKYERVAVAEEAAPYGENACCSGDVARVARLAKALLSEEPTEVFLVFLLDNKHRVLGYHEVARGGLATCAVEPASIVWAALIANAPAIVMAHCHPSGDPTPSDVDIEFTRSAVKAAKMLGIRVLDHVIVGDGVHVSLLDRGSMPSS